MTQKFCIGIVLYNPTPQDLKRLEQYITCGLFEEVLVYDNSSMSHQARIPIGIKYVCFGKNQALAIPYNKMISHCLAKHYDYLCLMDQDSNYPLEEIKKLIDFMNAHSKDLKNTAIIAPRVYTRSDKPKRPRTSTLTLAKWVINSGSFLNLVFLKEKNLFYDEKIFLDALDFDFCWCVHEKGGAVQIYEDSVFTQNMGQTVKGSFFRGHAPTRYYTIVHNKKHIHRKHLGYLLGSAVAIIKTGSTISKVLLYEENKWPKLKNCLKGLFR